MGMGTFSNVANSAADDDGGNIYIFNGLEQNISPLPFDGAEDVVRSMIDFNGELYFGLGDQDGEADLYRLTSAPKATSSYALQFATDSGLGYNATGSIWFESRDIFGGFNDDISGDFVPGTFFMSHSLVTNAGAYDVAEDYPTRDSDLIGGDLLMYDIDHEGGMTKATAENRHLLAGVVSARPGFLLSQADRTGMVPTALVGRVPVTVSTENGAIAVGDSITISSLPGVGMRASFGDRAVGYALESLEASPDDEVATSTVLVFVTTHTALGISPDLDLMMASSSTSTAETTLRQDTFFGRLTDLARNFVDGVLTLVGIKAEQVQTEKLCIGNTCVTESELQQLLQNNNQTSVAPDEPLAPPDEETPPSPPDPTEEPLVDEGEGSGNETNGSNPPIPLPDESPIPEEPTGEETAESSNPSEEPTIPSQPPSEITG
jgi:hypothetical protein